MSDTKDDAVPEEVADTETAKTGAARGRGRPVKPPEQRRTKHITVSFTEDEYGDVLLAAALLKQQLKDWARNTLLEAVPTKKEE